MLTKQTDMNLDNQMQTLLCSDEGRTPIFQRVSNTSPLSADTRAIVRENVLQFQYKQQLHDEPEGITACYERLSQEDKNDGESNSIATQKKILERYCKERGYTPIRHYDEDDGYSGTNWNRPGFQRLLADIKAGKIARVVVKDMSRLGRDYLQVGMYTDVIFPEYGVHFVAVNDNVDSTRGENEFAAIRNVFNEMFARDTSNKIRATWQNKGKSGERLTTNPLFGYVKDPDDKKKWVVDEEAAAVVQKIFSLCVDGLGVTQIARWLRENKIKNPTARMVERGLPTSNKPTADPCKWTSETVVRILERIEYLGHTVNFKTYRQSFKQRKKLFNDPDKWLIFENTHEPIITESVFLIVQNLRKTRKRPTKMGDMGLFSSIVFCEDCGGKMYLCRANHFKPEQAYYICSTYRKDRELCTTHSIRTVVLEEIVLRNLREAINFIKNHEDDFIREAADVSVRERDRELATKKKSLAEAEKRIAELDLIVKRLYEDNFNGKLTDERFIKLSRDYELEQNNLTTAAEVMRQDIKQQAQKKGNLNNFIAATKKYTDIQTLDATVLREFVDRIEISANENGRGRKADKDRKIHIVYNFIGAFDFVEAVTQSENKATKTEQLQQKTA